jgi:hypothetical protein
LRRTTPRRLTTIVVVPPRAAGSYACDTSPKAVPAR